jgi:hypothetical protein
LRSEDQIVTSAATVGNGVDYDRLYVVNDPFAKGFVRGAVVLPADIRANRLLTGEWHPSKPIPLKRASGRVLAPVVWTDHTAVILLSKSLAAAMATEGFSGWTTYPVQLETAPPVEPYVGLTVTGRCGPLEEGRGEWVYRDDRPGRFLRGLFFDEHSWDGSDFFRPAGTLYVFVTERARDILVSKGGASVVCERLSDVTTSEAVLRHTPKHP